MVGSWVRFWVSMGGSWVRSWGWLMGVIDGALMDEFMAVLKGE